MTLMTLSLSTKQDLRSSFLIFTRKNSQFPKPQNPLQLLLISIYCSSEIKKQQYNDIVNFPVMSSNIPSAPVYGVYASQLIRYACCCSNYNDLC